MGKTESMPTPAKSTDKGRVWESVAMTGMLLIAGALVLPLFQLTNLEWLTWLKWVYSVGALLYFVARVASAMQNHRGESVRLKRLRRMPAWAGMAFVVAAGFWFYSEAHLGPYAGPLAVLRQTILFSLVGAVLQIVSSWMIYSREQKEKRGE